jgi:hypothetical protein
LEEVDEGTYKDVANKRGSTRRISNYMVSNRLLVHHQLGYALFAYDFVALIADTLISFSAA